MFSNGVRQLLNSVAVLKFDFKFIKINLKAQNQTSTQIS